MKVMAFFLGIMILVLSCLPCQDSHATSSSTEISAIHDEDSHQEHTDLCSPFCYCSCCMSQAFCYGNNLQHVEFSKIDFHLPILNFIRPSNIPLQPFSKIWQPPKL